MTGSRRRTVIVRKIARYRVYTGPRVDIFKTGTYQMVGFVESEVLPQKCEDPLNLPVAVHLVVALLQDGRIARCLKSQLD